VLICDTSGLVALADAADPEHLRMVAAVGGVPYPWQVSPFVLAEADYLCRRRIGAEATRRLLADVAAGVFSLAVMTGSDVGICRSIDARYGALGLGLTDASLVVLAERYGTRDLLTLDERHFRAVTPLQGGAFRLLPADA